ncbi:EXS family-domain-containing protein [Lipomyces japonicus]|uniref:EXS family-domain-containing protein n=1 Tax=Lipomyces japonicus TaxID=56871 RepID=UPI0034CE223A
MEEQDGQVTVESFVPVSGEISFFNLYLPLPYRVIFTVVLGIWAYGVALHTLERKRIDVGALLRHSTVSAPPLYRAVYQVAAVLTVVTGANGLLYRLTIQPTTGAGWDALPMFCLITIPVVFMYPGLAFHRPGRYRFVRTLRRISLGGLDKDSRFSDIIVADVLTSYTKIIGDLWVVLCLFCRGHSITTAFPDRLCGGRCVAPFVVAIPYAIRLRQCLIDYVRSGMQDLNHLMNAVKYFSSFPVIILTSVQSGSPATVQAFTYVDQHTIYKLWILSMFVNSIGSFYWDVTKDWDLTVFKFNSKEPNLKGLRAQLYFNSFFYYFAILADLILRLIWITKLFPGLQFFNGSEKGLFAIELLEIFRRWVWLLLRLETEWIRTSHLGKLPVNLSEVAETKDY